MLQHSWASISHELQYKKTYEIPNQLKRKLFRLAGLFELADEQFGELKVQHNQIESQVFENDNGDNKDSNDEINLITIDHLIQKSEIVSKLVESANRVGFLVETDEEKELSKKAYKETLSSIIKLLKEIGIDSIEKFEKTLEESLSYSDKYFDELLQASGMSVWSGWRDFFTELILMTKQKEIDRDYYINNGWYGEIFDTVQKVAKKYYS